MPAKPIHRRCCVVALLGAMSCTSAQADRPGGGDGEHDHERARHALDRGEVRPIAEIPALVAAKVPGEVVEVEFERLSRHGEEAWVYELKILTEDGRLLEVRVDAATGHFLEVEED